jgi:3-methyladenine DNA glycosylase AlkD
MLKVASKTFLEEVNTFVLKYKDIMPRTSLRYAIEHFPDDKKQKAMRR